MNDRLSKKSILKKTFQYGGFTFLSRILGMTREMLQVRLLGLGAISDAFLTAFWFPNSLRKVFAEGALSAAFVPTFIKIAKDKEKESPSRLMSAAFLFFEGIVLILCIFFFFFPRVVIKMVAAGFSEPQILYAVSFLRILFPFIFFISSSALLAGALQSVNHFFVPAFAPVVLNVAYISGLLLCLCFNFSLMVLCVGILLGGCLHFLLHLLFYFIYKFKFKWPDKRAMINFGATLTKFGNCLFAVSIMEINNFVDRNIASFLAEGSVSLLYYGFAFIRIPLGVFAVGFATVMLSHLSRTVLHAPKRLSFYLLEATKLTCWVVLPSSLLLMFFSEKLFSTLLFGSKVGANQLVQAATILIIFSVGLLFFSWSKVLSNIFYSFHDTWTPTLIGIIATFVNFISNLISFFFLGRFAIFGIAASTVLYGVVMSVLSFLYLHKKHKVSLHLKYFLSFLFKYFVQILVIFLLFYFLHFVIFSFLQKTMWYTFFYKRYGYWLIAVPLGGLIFLSLFFSRKLFNIKLYFLDR